MEAYLSATTNVCSYPNNIMYVENIDKIPHWLIDNYGFVPAITEDSYNDFVRGLIEYGLVEHEIELIVERYLNNTKWGDIAVELGWTSIRAARMALKHAEDKLRVKGFKPRTDRQ